MIEDKVRCMTMDVLPKELKDSVVLNILTENMVDVNEASLFDIFKNEESKLEEEFKSLKQQISSLEESIENATIKISKFSDANKKSIAKSFTTLMIVNGQKYLNGMAVQNIAEKMRRFSLDKLTNTASVYLQGSDKLDEFKTDLNGFKRLIDTPKYLTLLGRLSSTESKYGKSLLKALTVGNSKSKILLRQAVKFDNSTLRVLYGIVDENEELKVFISKSFIRKAVVEKYEDTVEPTDKETLIKILRACMLASEFKNSYANTLKGVVKDIEEADISKDGSTGMQLRKEFATKIYPQMVKGVVLSERSRLATLKSILSYVKLHTGNGAIGKTFNESKDEDGVVEDLLKMGYVVSNEEREVCYEMFGE